MGKIEETREFLELIGMPRTQQTDICCYVILAMAGIKPDMSWDEATNDWIRIHDIIQFANTYYGSTYAENSRETFRKQALHRFRTAALVEDNGVAKFPDAPTERGAKHLRELVKAKEEGYEAAVLFVVQMKGIKEFCPNEERDPAFTAALREASAAGVKILAYDCHVEVGKVWMENLIPVIL